MAKKQDTTGQIKPIRTCDSRRMTGVKGKRQLSGTPQFRVLLLRGLYLSIVIQIKRYNEYYGVTLFNFFFKKRSIFPSSNMPNHKQDIQCSVT